MDSAKNWRWNIPFKKFGRLRVKMGIPSADSKQTFVNITEPVVNQLYNETNERKLIYMLYKVYFILL